MEEQLISFETAKLAKEKGFDVGVNQAYIIYKKSYNYDDDPNHRESYKVNDVELNSHYHVNNYKGIDLSNEYYEAYSAPTQSLLQKWLRDKCKIQIEITYYRDGDCYFVKLCSYKDSNLYFSTYINTYEEALEEGLQEALKLIKIKNNE